MATSSTTTPEQAISADELLCRYRKNYGIGSEVELSVERVWFHFNLERRLTAELLASTPANRSQVFQRCYDELYRQLPWLTDTGGTPDAHLWMTVLGPPPRKVYEIGSGTGQLAHRLAAAGYQVEATDIAADRGGKRRTSERLSWSITDGVHLDRFAQAAPYDAVVSDQVIEHLHPDDLRAHLLGCLRILRPGGLYLFRTPHAFTGPHDMSRVFGYEETVGMHLHEYTNRELIRASHEVGFRSVAAVIGIPQRLRQERKRAIASKAYLRYLLILESLTRRLPPPTRRSVLRSLRGPLHPRIFLLAKKPAG